MSDTPAIEAVRSYLMDLQASIVGGVRALDPVLEERVDSWERPEGGGGTSRALGGGAVFEKGGVNFSDVSGGKLPPSATAARPQLAGCGFRAMGVSVVLHPCSPYIPTTHMNVRYFEAQHDHGEGDSAAWWFGGGFDLTPIYPFEADAIFWHERARAACAPHEGAYSEAMRQHAAKRDAGPAEPPSASLYETFKTNCDRYFMLPHRAETRGVGGLFFDDFNLLGFDESFGLMKSIGSAFFPAFEAIVQRRRLRKWGERERQFQLYRRGRYVEFNLLYDRGTQFGVQSGGRTESILMSMPPLARWEYDFRPEPGSPEAELAEFLKPRDWLAKQKGRTT